MIYLIGCGGVGSFLSEALCRLHSPSEITLVDGDTLERKNLDRQIFRDSDIGKNKASALADRMKCQFIGKWYSESLVQHNARDWIIGAVDNNSARRSILISADMAGCNALFGANETHSSEAYVYLPRWINTRLDPRVMYPEILTDRENDPRAAAIGCTGEAQIKNRQLVTANFMAAALVAHLFVVWSQEARKLPPESIQFLPHKLVQNLTKNETFRVGVL